MITSTWSDWFVREEIEGADPSGMSVWFLGCNGFVVRTAETTLYVDPYFGTGEHRRYAIRMCPVPMDPTDATKCDAVLATHEHTDHLHPPSFEPLLSTGANLYGPPTALDTLSEEAGGPPQTQYRRVVPDNKLTIGDISVYVRGATDPDSHQPVSYVFEHEDEVFFHGGDSRPTHTFDDIGREFDIDLGALAFGSIGHVYNAKTDSSKPEHWYMDENAVIKAANQLRLTRLFPTHWNMWKGLEADPSGLTRHATTFSYPKVVEIGSVGDRYNVDKPGKVPPMFVKTSDS